MNKEFPAALNKLYEMLDFIRQNAEAAGFDQKAAVKIELALEEALVNIVKHGYQQKIGTIQISCSPSDQTPGLKIILKDQGIPYNPLLKGKNSHAMTSSKTQEPGGYGILLILQIMDEVFYERDERFNCLTLIKYHDPGQ
jgi:serine/threonine-protein kinase RsbW